MKKILFAACSMLAIVTSSQAACVLPDDWQSGGFYNKNCVTQEQAEAIAAAQETAYQQPGYSRTTIWDHGNSPAQDRAASAVTTRNYALGSEPRRGQPGTQSLPRGLTELSRRQMSQALSRRTQLTGPAVHTDPVTGEKTLRSVEITYGVPAGRDHRGNDSRTSYNDNMGGSGRSHQGM